jgi:hypothetical protein
MCLYHVLSLLVNTLSFSANINAVNRSFRFMLYNISRGRPYLTQKVAQVLIQAFVISHLDYCNSVEARLHYKTMVLANVAAKELQIPSISLCSKPIPQPEHSFLPFWSLDFPTPSSRSAQSRLFYVLAPEWWNLLS